MNTLQSVEERKKYQLVEQFLLYSQEWSNWLTNSSTHLEEHETFKNQIKRQLNDLREKVKIYNCDFCEKIQFYGQDAVFLQVIPSNRNQKFFGKRSKIGRNIRTYCGVRL